MRTTTTAVLAVGADRLGHPDRRRSARRSPRSRPRSAGHLTVAQQMRAAATELAQQRLTRKAWRLADKVADARDRGFSPRAYRRRVKRRLAGRARAPHPRRCGANCAPPAAPSGAAPRGPSPPPPRSRRSPPASPAATPATDTGNGFYGKYQFTLSTWASVGGSGNPAAAGEAEQNRARGDALRARGRLALARVRPLVVSGRMALRDEFPVLEQVAYLNAGTDGPIPRAATELVQQELARGARGRTDVAALRAPDGAARTTSARATRELMNCEADDVAVTTGTSFGLGCVLAGMDLGPGDEIVTSDNEHPGPARAADRRPPPRRDGQARCRSPSWPKR